MAEQIFAAMSFGLSWHRLLKVSFQVFLLLIFLLINQHFGGHQFSTSSKLKQEFQREHPPHKILTCLLLTKKPKYIKLMVNVNCLSTEDACCPCFD